ncbi:MAG: hypothetical protein IIB57_15420, partial [Planctomycetes bacterium]|nr:hypothetical protein [Planctomycetota bacterium]
MKWQTAIVFIICLVVSAQHAHAGCELPDVNVYPSRSITEHDSIVFEVYTIMPSLPAFLFEPTEVTWQDNEVVINIHVDSGFSQAITSFVEHVPLGKVAAGVYHYTVIVEKAFGETATVMGTFTVVAAQGPDQCEHLYWSDRDTRSFKRSDLDSDQRRLVAPFIVSG